MILRKNTYSNIGCWSRGLNEFHWSQGFHSLLWNVKIQDKGLSGALTLSFIWKNVFMPRCWSRGMKNSKLKNMS